MCIVTINLKDVDWRKYRVFNADEGYNSEKVLKLIDLKNSYDIEFVFNKLKNEQPVLNTEDKESAIINSLYKSNFGKTLFKFNKYIKNKIHYAKHILQIDDSDTEEDLSILLNIYEKIEYETNLLDQIHLYYTYSNRNLETSYAVNNKIDVNRLETVFNDNFIKKNIISSGKFECIYHKYDKTSEYICGIYFPGERERYAEAFENLITYNPKEAFIIYYDSHNNNFIFRGSNKYAEKFKNVLEKNLDIEMFEWGNAIDFDATSFMNRLKQKPSKSELSLTALYINGLSLGKNVDLLLSQNSSRKNDISDKINQLISTKSITINSFKDINYLKIFYKIPMKNTLKEREVKVVYDTTNTKVKLILNSKDLIPIEKAFVKDHFQKEFGIPLEKTLKPELFQNGILDLYKHILLKDKVENLESTVRGIFNELLQKDFVNIDDERTWCCENCDEYNDISVNNCKTCHTEKKPNAKTYSTYSINEEKINEYIIDLLKKIIPTFKDSSTNDNKDFYITTIKNHNDDEMYIVLSSNKLSVSYINKLKRESKAVIFVLSNQNTAIDNTILCNDLFSYIPLEYFLAYEKMDPKEVEDLIKNRYEICINKANIIAENATVNSLDNLKNTQAAYATSKIKGDCFENDIYNLFRYIFKTTKQLGKNLKGKKVPDGYFDIHITGGSEIEKEKKYTLLWDAKYSEKVDGYDLDISEKRKLVEYINKYNSDYEIRRFSTQNTLDVFIIVYNNMSENKFSEIASYVREKSEWKGKLLFLNSSALSYLTQFILQYNEQYQSKRNVFNNDFMNNIVKINDLPEYNFSIANEGDIKKFIELFDKRTKTIESIHEKVE